MTHVYANLYHFDTIVSTGEKSLPLIPGTQFVMTPVPDIFLTYDFSLYSRNIWGSPNCLAPPCFESVIGVEQQFTHSLFFTKTFQMGLTKLLNIRVGWRNIATDYSVFGFSVQMSRAGVNPKD